MAQSVLETLVSFQIGPGLIPRVDTLFGLSLSLVLIPASRFYCRYYSFPLSTKTNISKSQFALGNS